MMIEDKKKEDTVECCASLLDAYVDTLNIEECFEILGPIQYDNPELADFLLGCMICAWIESDVNTDVIKEQLKINYNAEIVPEKIEHLLFTGAYIRAMRYIEARDAAFKSRIPTFDMLTDKYGDKASSHLSQIFGRMV